VISKAAVEARELRHHWLGGCHYLLAVLAEPSTATQAMAELGATHARLAREFGAINTSNGRRIRYFASKGVSTNPTAHDVSGWAKGFAAAASRRTPSPEDWLLATVYNDPMVRSILHGLGIRAAAIVEALRRRGVKVPTYEPEEHRPWRGSREIEITRADMPAVLKALNEMHPPGSEWEWGFNVRKDRPGKVQLFSEEGIDLEAVVAEALAVTDRTKP
jgi:hypothetical protein